MKKLASEKTLNIMIFIFLIMQPFLEIYWLYHFDGIENSFSFSPSTIIRLVWFMLIGIIFLFNMNKKKFIRMIGLTSIFILYALLHDYFASDTKLYWSSSYTFLSEIFYILRVAIPIFLLYIFCNFKVNEKLFDIGIFIVAYVFGIIMIVTNITMTALPAYPFSDGIAGNIFTWFTARQNDITFEVLATKGIFNQANQVSGFLILLFPLLVYSLYKKFNIAKLIAILMMIISMFMMGTRVLGWGVLIVLPIMLGIYIFMHVMKKHELRKEVVIANILVLIFAVGLFFFSPLMLRGKDIAPDGIDVNILGKQNQEYLNEYVNGVIPGTEFEKKAREFAHIDFIRDNAVNFSVPLEFIRIYNYEKDPYFWLSHFSLDSYKKRGNYRVIQSSIWKRINENYGNVSTTLFGFSNSVAFNGEGVMLEKDIIAQKYYLGYLGLLIFIVPFIVIVGYGIYRILKNIELFNFKNLSYILALGLTLCVSVFSGNMMDIFVVTIPLAMVSSMLVYNLTNKEKEI